MDGVVASSLFPLFGLIYQALKSMGFLKSYEILGGNLGVAESGYESVGLIPQEFVSRVK